MDNKPQIDDSQRSPKIQRMLGEKLPRIIRHGTLLVLAIFIIILSVIALLIPVSEDGTTIFGLLAN